MAWENTPQTFTSERGLRAALIFALAAERWTVERNLAANRRYSTAHTASVFEDKLDFDDRHREAAETLYISVKTLEVHLGHAVQKIREALRKKNIC